MRTIYREKRNHLNLGFKTRFKGTTEIIFEGR